MEIINNILSVPAVAMSTVTQGLSNATNTVNNYVVQPAFNGLCSGATLAKDGINAVVVKPVVFVAQNVITAAKVVDPYVSAAAGIAGAGLCAKGVYDLNNSEVTDKSDAKKMIAGGSLALLYTTTRFAISYFTKEAPEVTTNETPNLTNTVILYLANTAITTAAISIPVLVCNHLMRNFKLDLPIVF